MKPQTALKSLMLIAIFLVSALVGFGGAACGGVHPTSPARLGETTPRGVLLAAKGVEVGRLADDDDGQLC